MERVFEEDVNNWLNTLSYRIYFKSQESNLLLKENEILYIIRLWIGDRSQDDAIRTIIGGIIFDDPEALALVRSILEEVKRRCVDYVLNTPITETITSLKSNPNDFFDWLISINANFSPQFCGEDPIWIIDEKTITGVLDFWLAGKNISEAIPAYYQKTYPDYSGYDDDPGQVEYLSKTLEEAEKWCVEAIIGLE